MAILIIEDNPLNTKLVRDLLRASGYATLEAADATAGMMTARRHKPELIVLDIDLPGMNGLDAARALKSDPLTAAIPILALTAYAISIRHFLDRVRALLGTPAAT